MLVEETCEVGVHALISADQLVGKSKAWHHSSFLEPKDRTEASTEEDSLHASESHQALCERAVSSDPLESPLGLLLYRRNILNGIEQEIFLGSIRNVGVDDQGVGL